MREINKTIYNLVKQSDPDDGISVTQLITDEVVKQSESGEVIATNKDDATGLLDLKATQLAKEQSERESTNTAIKRQIKASGKKVKTAPPQASPASAVHKKKVVKKVIKGATGVKQVRGAKKVKKKVVKKQSNSLSQILLLIIILAAGAYFYLNQ